MNQYHWLVVLAVVLITGLPVLVIWRFFRISAGRAIAALLGAWGALSSLWAVFSPTGSKPTIGYYGFMLAVLTVSSLALYLEPQNQDSEFSLRLVSFPIVARVGAHR